MTLLMMALDDREATVITDTLATSGDRPWALQAKFAVVPAMGVVITGTGVANLLLEWVYAVSWRVIARDIDDLNSVTSDALRELWAATDKPDRATATIYQVGYSPALGRYVALRYDSRKDFEGTVMQPGFYIKPDPAPPSELLDWLGAAYDGDQLDWIAVAEKLRTQEDAVEPGQGSSFDGSPIRIGGALVSARLAAGQITIETIHEWPDRDDVHLAALRFRQS